MAQVSESKWEGKATAKVVGSAPELVWPFLEDFCNVQKCDPDIGTCYRVDGEYGKPGLIRYCVTTISSSSGEAIVKWCHEKLLAMDPIKRCFTYDVLDSNMGFKKYFSTIKVFAIDGGDEEPGSEIEWSFVAQPIDGVTYDQFFNFIDTTVHTMAETIGKTLQSTE